METATAIRQVNRKIRPSARCQRGATQFAKKCTTRVSRNGFLKHGFKPFWAFDGNRDRAKREFENSLAQLCSYYGLAIPQPANDLFPQRIYQTWQVVSEALKAKDKQLECIIAGDEQHIATLATVSRYDTGMNLYYIPVRPLWHWVQRSQGQRLAELLLAICAYLHQVVGIPFYTENGSYVGCQYQMIEDWVNDDQEDEEDRQQQLGELYTMHNAGLKLHEQIRKPYYLEHFASITDNFHPIDEWEQGWQVIGAAFLSLYRTYPQRSIFDNIHSGLLYPEDEDHISADQYISFYWSGNGCLADTLFDTINCDFQEIAYMDEPIHLQKFDKLPKASAPDFGFENRLFDLIDRFCKLLNDHDDEKCEPNV